MIKPLFSLASEFIFFPGCLSWLPGDWNSLGLDRVSQAPSQYAWSWDTLSIEIHPSLGGLPES